MKLAVLIDADNTSHKNIGLVLQEIAKYGVPIVKRVYGDWSSEIDENGKPTNRLHVWRDVSLSYAITPVQQFAYTKGKDATDMILIINAMDLLYGNQLDGFCIISSDSDFTPLASRIRESGLTVFGFGKKQTPSPFINACDKFIYIENLLENDINEMPNDKENLSKLAERNKMMDNASISSKDNTKQSSDDTTQKPTATPNQHIKIDEPTLQLIYKSIKDIADDDGWANLSTLGNHLATIKPDFDTRTYGRAKLSGLLQALDLFEIKLESSQKFVRKKPSFAKVLKIVHDTMIDYRGLNEWAFINPLAIEVSKRNPTFNPKTFGYQNIQSIIKAIDSKYFEFNENKTQIKLLSIKAK
ncbi:MAG: NYN domain-containing protein [Moraxella sp.]|nr:NYN domain-containing protein [Moraxella sp.]